MMEQKENQKSENSAFYFAAPKGTALFEALAREIQWTMKKETKILYPNF